MLYSLFGNLPHLPQARYDPSKYKKADAVKLNRNIFSFISLIYGDFFET